MTVTQASTTRREARSKPELPLVLHTRVVTGAGGGPDKTILNSPRFLPELGYRSICAYMRSPNDAGFAVIRRRAGEWSAPLLEVDDGGPLAFRSIIRRYNAICRDNNVAIWHGHDYKSNLIGLLVRRHWPMKLVTTVHGWVKHTWRTPLYYAIDRHCLRWYDRVICVSDDLYQASLDAGVRPQRCVLIENAIDTSEFCRTQSRQRAKRKLGFDPQRPLIGAVGRLSAEKGFDVLIQGVAILLQEGCDVDLVIAGEGDHKEQLTSLIDRLGLQSQVKLLGYRADARELYEAFDALVLSSYREGLPNVLLESMAMDTPVVATAVAGVPKLIADDVNGLLVPPGDAAAVATALRRLIRDVDLHGRLASAGRETVEQRFSFQHRMEKVCQIYHDVLAPR